MMMMMKRGGGGGETYLHEGVSKICYTTTVYVAVLKMRIGSIGGNRKCKQISLE